MKNHLNQKPWLFCSVGFLCISLLAALPSAQARNYDGHVGLGVAAGASLPVASDAIQSGFEGVSFDWGFFVDIPLLSSFHITPSAMLYQLKVNDEWRSVTDLDLSFKFIIPLHKLSFNAGVSAGLTSGADPDANVITPHMGALAGVGYNLVSNLDLFVMATYKVLLHDLEKVNGLHAYTGLLIRL